MPLCVWPFQQRVDMFRNKPWSVKITHWTEREQNYTDLAKLRWIFQGAAKCWSILTAVFNPVINTLFPILFIFGSSFELITAESEHLVYITQCILVSHHACEVGHFRDRKVNSIQTVPPPLSLTSYQGDQMTCASSRRRLVSAENSLYPHPMS